MHTTSSISLFLSLAIVDGEPDAIGVGWESTKCTVESVNFDGKKLS